MKLSLVLLLATALAVRAESEEKVVKRFAVQIFHHDVRQVRGVGHLEGADNMRVLEAQGQQVEALVVKGKNLNKYKLLDFYLAGTEEIK